MERTNNKKVKLNNAGMTLVEILIAIAILSVAIIPLMFAFVNAMRYNTRGRVLQQGTALAHSIIETCKADSMNEVIYAIQSGSFVSGVSGMDLDLYDSNDDGKVTADELSYPFSFYLQNADLENQKCDVVLTFDIHEVNGAETLEILRSSSMNPYLDAMMTVQTKDEPTAVDAHTMANMDSSAYIAALEDIAAGIKAASMDNEDLDDLGVDKIEVSTQYIADSFKDGASHEERLVLMRTIVVNIDTDETDKIDTVTVTYNYSYKVIGGNYSFKTGYTDDEGNDIFLYYNAGKDIKTYSFDIYSNSNTKSSCHLENVYIMYYPAYRDLPDESTALYPFGSIVAGEENIAEYIVINNNARNYSDGVSGGRNINVYLIKQKNSNYVDDTAVANMETYYASNIKVSASSTTGATTNLYHNFDYNLGTGVTNETWTAPGIWSGVSVKSMINKESKLLMFDFNVNIYESGAIDSEDDGSFSLKDNANLILSMDGTDLDW